MKGAIVIRYALAAVLIAAAVFMSGCTVSCTVGEPGTTATTVGAANTATSLQDSTTAPAPATTTTATTAAPTTSSETTTGSTAKTTATSGKTSKTDVSTTDESLILVHPTLGTIVPIDQWTRYEETDPYIKWIGSWAFVASQYNSGGGYVWTTDVHANMVIPFKGTQIRLLGTTWVGGGIGSVTLDGGSVIEIDTYAGTATATAVIWTSPVLSNGTHHLTVGFTGTKNPKALMAGLTLDAAEIVGTIGN
jgi:hypothetical protein